MLNNSLTYLKNRLHAALCYHLIITPIHLPLPKEYRNFAQRGFEYIEGARDEVIHVYKPKHHVLHRFTPKKKKYGKKILVTHGWMSCSAYMSRLIHALLTEGYEVYALDFPAHGDAKGFQLLWTEAVSIIKKTINDFGPFYGVIGHSFGGSMLLNTITLSGELPSCKLYYPPEKVILIASPVRMGTPVLLAAKRLMLNSHSFMQLRKLFRQEPGLHPKLIRLNRFISQEITIPFLCIHGELDTTIPVNESIIFCNRYSNANLSLLPDADHLSVLIDDRVGKLACEFLQKH